MAGRAAVTGRRRGRRCAEAELIRPNEEIGARQNIEITMRASDLALERRRTIADLEMFPERRVMNSFTSSGLSGVQDPRAALYRKPGVVSQYQHT